MDGEICLQRYRVAHFSEPASRLRHELRRWLPGLTGQRNPAYTRWEMGAAIQPQPFGKYFLLERIATGGMAEIYKAKYRAEGGFEKTLVIKKILPHLAQDEEFITMFRDEAALTVRLNHANIVQVFDFGRNGEDYFLAMEYVQGQNLRAVMRRCQELGAPVPVPFALFAITEVAKGLAYAHARRDESDTAMQIVHRDVTPSNNHVS